MSTCGISRFYADAPMQCLSMCMSDRQSHGLPAVVARGYAQRLAELITLRLHAPQVQMVQRENDCGWTAISQDTYKVHFAKVI